MADEYEEILAGSLALGYLDCTLLEYARGIKYFVDQESRKYNCDTHLINLLRRAACVGWENIHMFKQPPNFSPADAEQLVRLREAANAALALEDQISGILKRWSEELPHIVIASAMAAHADRIAKQAAALRNALGEQEGESI